MNEHFRKSSGAYQVFNNPTTCTYDGKNLTIEVKCDSNESAEQMIKTMLTNFTNVTKKVNIEKETKIEELETDNQIS
jgi:hypothetical protein